MRALILGMSCLCVGCAPKVIYVTQPSAVIAPSLEPTELDYAPLCEKNAAGYFLLGPDGVVGFSELSCGDAWAVWNRSAVRRPTFASS